jgi:LysR family hydrogen peroxide-inducible transcriptional activator
MTLIKTIFLIYILTSSMNIQQFEYVLALADTRHFETAADRCHVTQSTLSTMIARLESELGITLFDRKHKPLRITSEGLLLIERMQIIVREITQLNEMGKELRGEVKGELTMAVIPTIAPFLLPLFLQSFAAQFPSLKIRVRELTTAEIMRQLKTRELDIGVLSTPLLDNELEEHHLYDEPFVFYDAGKKQPKSVTADKLDLRSIVLLEEGHCMRTQVVHFCDVKRKPVSNRLNFEFKAGSIDSLLRFVRSNKAATLLPYLATADMPLRDLNRVSRIAGSEPYRSIGIAVHRHFVKRRILELLQQDIMDAVRKIMPIRRFKGEGLKPLDGEK